jgi:dTDP-glucose 4,6-dehydratase
LLNELGKGEELIKQIPDPRKGAHDTRYSMDTTKSKALGWNPESDFAENLAKTVRWYVDNQDWWRALIARPEHQEFIRKFYGPGLGDDL